MTVLMVTVAWVIHAVWLWGRIAHFLGLQGPVMQLDTACSSALLAVQFS